MIFCFIGAVPGHLVDRRLPGDRRRPASSSPTATSPDDRPAIWAALDRLPLPYETSHPGVFAVGDVRAGSVKRVAAAVGEGSTAVRSIHTHLASHL